MSFCPDLLSLSAERQLQRLFTDKAFQRARFVVNDQQQCARALHLWCAKGTEVMFCKEQDSVQISYDIVWHVQSCCWLSLLAVRLYTHIYYVYIYTLYIYIACVCVLLLDLHVEKISFYCMRAFTNTIRDICPWLGASWFTIFLLALKNDTCPQGHWHPLQKITSQWGVWF